MNEEEGRRGREGGRKSYGMDRKEEKEKIGRLIKKQSLQKGKQREKKRGQKKVKIKREKKRN